MATESNLPDVTLGDDEPPMARAMLVISIVVAIGLVLVGLKVIPEWLDPGHQYDYKATLTISYTPNGGSMTTVQVIIDLDPEAAPIHVGNFVKLSARGEYEKLIFCIADD